jgi:hypothetical protein
MHFNPAPPYNVLTTRDLPFTDVQRLSRFARYWDLVANSGRHPRALALILGERPFDGFLALTDWLHRRLDATHRISAERLSEVLREWLLEHRAADDTTVEEAVAADYLGSGARGRPAFLQRGPAGARGRAEPAVARPKPPATPPRQARHLA